MSNNDSKEESPEETDARFEEYYEESHARIPSMTTTEINKWAENILPKISLAL